MKTGHVEKWPFAWRMAALALPQRLIGRGFCGAIAAYLPPS
ncbi:MAG TPA: hypothetical protein VJ806_04380 [Luteimonas sp.]|nr:hypothetical protein [Luteimonas sp.]